MSTYSKVDPGTLGWVKSEIDETLKQARLALEQYVENPADKTNLRFCITHLHQVVGTLLMVELDNAAMLAKETEALAEAVLSGNVDGSAAAFETLTRGILVLPDYLARLQFGQADSPLRNVALLNELRAARGAPPVSELDLFVPDLSVRPPPAERDGGGTTPGMEEVGWHREWPPRATQGAVAERLADEAFVDFVRQRRAAFQPLLLGWLRDATQSQALRDIGAILESLQRRAGVPAVEQMFWTGRGLLEGMADGGLEATVECKKLLSRLDQLIKKIIDGADKTTLRAHAEALTKAMLWEVAHAASGGALVTQLKRAFELDALLGAGSPPAEAEHETIAPEALQSVTAALAKEIESAQDLLSAYFDPEQKGAVALEPLLDHLRRIGGTLDMLGLAPLKQLDDELLDLTRAILERRIADVQAVAMPMAEALLLIERNSREMPRPDSDWERHVNEATAHLHALHTPGAARPADTGLVVGEAALSETDLKQLLATVADEANINLGKIEEAVESFAKTPPRPALLGEVPALLSQIQGAAQILGQEPLAELTGLTRGYIQELRDGVLIVDAAVLDGLAVCIGTIGAHLDGLKAGRRNLEALIDSALREMAAATEGKRRPGPVTAPAPEPADPIEALRAAIGRWLERPDDTAARDGTRAQLDSLARTATGGGQERLRQVCETMRRVLDLVPADTALLPVDVADILRQSLAVLPGLAAAHTPPPPKVAPLPHEFDQEILPIFIEDARDVLSNVVREFARWRQDPDNREALTEVRRGYHTLKGSGRMVGAADIAEHAWAVERILNRLRDGRGKPTEAVFDLLQRTQDALPQMIAQLERGTVPSVDVAALRAEAEALAAAGGQPVLPVAAPPPRSPAPAGVPGGLPRIDRALLDIFTAEARGHLATLRDEVAACRASGVCFVSDALFRATHTLQGNARSLGLPTMAEASAEIEKLLHALKSKPAPMLPEHVELLAALEAAANDLVDALNNGGGDAATLERRFAEVTRGAREAHVRAESDQDFLPTEEITLESPASVPAPDDSRDGGGRATPGAVAEEIGGIGTTAWIHEVERRRATAGTPEVEQRREQLPEQPPNKPPVAAPPATPPLLKTALPPAVSDAEVEDIDPDLLDVFREEAVDILARVEESLTRWRVKPDDLATVLELKRALHTLKGGARMAGALGMGHLAHGTETVLKHVEDRRLSPGAVLFDLLDEIHDTLVAMLDALTQRKTPPDARDLAARVAALAAGGPLPDSREVGGVGTTARMQEVERRRATAGTPEVEQRREQLPEQPPNEPPRATPGDSRDGGGRAASGTATGAVAGTAAEAVVPVSRPAPVASETEITRSTDPGGEAESEARQTWPETMERRGQVRVSTGLLSNLVNYAGEVSIARARMEQQVYSFRDNLAELARNVIRFRDQIRELEIQSESQILYRLDPQGEAVTGEEGDFDPLEFDRFTKLQQLSRQLAESLHDLTTIQGNLGNFIGEAQTALAQQARINTELQEGLMRTRMVRFDTLAGRLRHIVRTTARELGKRVELNLIGAEVELDRNVLERMIGPFEHMIRNAIDHGMEPEAARVRAGKPAAGRITVATAQEGSEIVIRFSDDGRGLDIEAIRAKAVERGMMAKDAALSEEELIQFILAPGFSTAREVTHFSGRGVGMDVVHNEVKQLGGSMSVDTNRGAGTTFVIHLPLTLSIAQALMVHVGDQQFAVPLAAVVNIIEYPVEQLNRIAVGNNPLLNYRDQVYPYMHLGRRLGLPATAPDGDKVPILLVRTGTREVALQVDGLRGTREVVIKALGPQLAELKGLAGATILGDGRVVLILDAAGLWYRDDSIHVEHAAGPQVTVEEARGRPVVMVVDDSLTVRKVTSKHLQKRGLDVMVAKDGVDAVEQLRERVPDLLLVDIEMPRMDGYELTVRVRGDARLKHIPIIMITSRAGAKHRQKAMELGVDLYMSKPYQEEELFQNVDNLLAGGPRA